MGKKLIIVESPAKIKTLKKFLGDDYIFESSVGHIRDLPEKGFGIDLETFEPEYTTLPEKKDVISKLRKAASLAEMVYLSPDPDREGEAIAWHILQVLPEGTPYKRVSFNSITKEAVTEALTQPREIDIALVNAQQARRLLDRIVGYKISPILNRRIQRGREGSVSAGRVQSVALKLVVEREKEIEAFKPIEYWTLSAFLASPGDATIFSAYLYSVDGNKVEKEPIQDKDVTLISNKETADALLERMNKGKYQVASVDRKEKKRQPVPPFITSTLQQEASRHFGFSSARTMSIAQSLYEGVDLGNEGAEGLITYMRTDSVRVAPEALTAVRKLIGSQYGADYLPDAPRSYSSKKSAQDAHEAIRPTNLNHPPERVQSYLNREQFLLYSLIWKRFVASQMNPAIYDTVSADIESGNGLLVRATGSVQKFPGFLAAYEEKNDDDENSEERRPLPNLAEGQQLQLKDLTSEQSFTKPPPRYTEASLVKELEKSGIGRPSTYAAIMNKIQSRDYTVKDNKRLKPTELGRVIAALLEDNFTQIMNIGFTALMEDELEHVAENRKDWKELLKEFWTTFKPTLETAEKGAFVPKLETDIDCPKCGAKLQKVWYRDRYFFGCSKYPECDYSATAEEMTFNKEDYAEDFDWAQPCPNCGSAMKVRHGRFGAFLGCTKYPDCKGIVSIPKKGESYIPPAELPPCPAIGCGGHMVARKSRFGKTFYSCSNFPDCDVICNDLTELENKYPDHPKTAYIRKTPAKGKKKGKTTEKATKETKKKATPKKAATPRKTPQLKLSKELSEFAGVTEMGRGEVMKKVWEYIKANDLQDPANKRTIKPDAKLATLLGEEPIDMFAMTKVLSKHLKGTGAAE
ncbi:MAG: type I DNA topoisomerase [Chlamydiales bacterium]|nr:type I DNA topoisomerase [Chlamydiales bacterium]